MTPCRMVSLAGTRSRNEKQTKMTNANDEDLLGFLLGALDESDRLRIESQLEDNEPMRARLIALQAALDPLDANKEDDSDCEPPPNLAELTCAAVESYEFEKPTPKPPTAPQATFESPPTSGWRFAEVSFLSGMAIAAALLFMPMIAQSRFQSQVVSCQNQLRSLGLALAGYSETNVGRLPEIPTSGKLSFAGAYAPVLREAKFLTNEEWVHCPAANRKSGDRQLIYPTLDDIRNADGERLIVMRSNAGGDYGFTLGFVADDGYQPTRHEGRSTFPLMADAPTQAMKMWGSSNHGLKGQNVLYDDFHVSFAATNEHSGDADHLYTNHAGLPAAGVDARDAVIGASHTRPIPVIYSQ